MLVVKYACYVVSIHAPARGATPMQVFLRRADSCFNPRTREGCDTTSAALDRDDDCFNPRTREGCDKRFGYALYDFRRFNPRTREGCDMLIEEHTTAYGCFNPRTREGCDDAYRRAYDSLRMFQSTHPRGVRLVTR